MANYTITQGQDLVVTLNIINSDNEMVDLSYIDSLRVGFTVGNYQIPKKYMDSSVEGFLIPGYGEAIRQGINEVDIYLEREDTMLFPVGDLYAIVLVTYPSTYLDGETKEYKLSVGEVKRGYMLDEQV